MQPRDHAPDAGMKNHRPRHRQPNPEQARAGEDLRREELLRDHHIEELLGAISALFDSCRTLGQHARS